MHDNHAVTLTFECIQSLLTPSCVSQAHSSHEITFLGTSLHGLVQVDVQE